MALRSTVYKAALQIADIDRHYYAEHSLVIARHPSETDERMMMRVLAFALNADEALEFGRGLSSEDKAALWRRDLTGALLEWVDVGLPDEKWVRRACAQSERVALYLYGRTADLWWEQNRGRLARHGNLEIYKVGVDESQALAGLAERTMQLSCSIQDGAAWVSGAAGSVQVIPQKLYPL